MRIQNTSFDWVGDKSVRMGGFPRPLWRLGPVNMGLKGKQMDKKKQSIQKKKSVLK